MKIIGIELFIINDSKKLRVSMSKSFEGSSKKSASGYSHNNFKS